MRLSLGAVADGEEAPAIRGIICREFVEWLAIDRGPDYVADCITRARPEDVQGLHTELPLLGLLPQRFYPAERMHQLLDVLTADIPHSEHDRMCQRAGEYIFDRQVRGLQRAIFALMLSPSRYVKHAHRAWRHNFRDGEVTYEAGDDWHRSTYTNWGGQHPLICRMMMYGKASEYRVMGCQEPTVEVERLRSSVGARAYGPCRPCSA